MAGLSQIGCLICRLAILPITVDEHWYSGFLAKWENNTIFVLVKLNLCVSYELMEQRRARNTKYKQNALDPL